MSDERSCESCGETKPIEAFPWSHVDRNERGHQCTSCLTAERERARQDYRAEG